jgi:hypothetical protein
VATDQRVVAKQEIQEVESAKRNAHHRYQARDTKKAAKKLDLIQTQVAQRHMLRVEVYARALRASQNSKRYKEGGAQPL